MILRSVPPGAGLFFYIRFQYTQTCGFMSELIQPEFYPGDFNHIT